MTLLVVLVPVFSVVTGSAATLRQQWGDDEKFNLTDPSEYAASTNEVCLLAQYLTEQLQYQLSAIPQDRALHQAWTSDMDITTSLRDMTLFNMLGDYFHKKFEREEVCQSGVSVSVCLLGVLVIE